MEYYLAWRVKRTGYVGRGSGKYPREEARKYCGELNKQDKGYIEHELLPESKAAEFDAKHGINQDD